MLAKKHLLALPCMFLLIAAPARADWPSRVFAPYFFWDSGDRLKLTDVYAATGQKYFTLAFIIADRSGAATWNGQIPMSEKRYGDQIAALRATGGDVIVSFGGEAGKEVAITTDSAQDLAVKYQSVIDAYKLTWLDFDIEGRGLENADANQRRNAAIKMLQVKYPGLRITYTLPADPDGLSSESQDLLRDAHQRGVVVNVVNPMTMYFGSRFIAGTTESAVAIQTLEKVHEQVAAIDPAMKIGATPNIGVNGEKDEIFNQSDAATLEAWCESHPWMVFEAFWSANRDNGAPRRHGDDTSSGIQQKPWEFTNAFKAFTK